MKNRKTIYAYINGKRQYDILLLALKNNVTADEMKDIIRKANLNNKVEFKVEEEVYEGALNNHSNLAT